jgi:esterase
MKLHFKKFGEGSPVIILHGLFGSGDNWTTFGKKLSEYSFAAYLIDLRNHGHSPWGAYSYRLMADDVFEFVNDNQLHNPVLLGHSMGGKTAMQFAIQQSKILSALIVADIAPRYYKPHHQLILKALSEAGLEPKSRKDAETILSKYISDTGTRQFLLKNLYWKTPDQLAWRFNLNLLMNEIESTGNEITSDMPVNIPVLFVKGERSDYILKEDEKTIFKLFPKAEIEEVKDSGHWIHADQPDLLLQIVLRFLNNNVKSLPL